jgi:hypothetical protein
MKYFLLLALTGAAVAATCALSGVSVAEERRGERERDREREKGRGGSSIEGIMKTVHGRNGLMKSLDVMLKKDDVAWQTVQATTGKIALLAADLGKRRVKKGSADSWAELTELYADRAKELNDAAKKKDLVATKDAYTDLNSSCNKCHDRHKGR